MGFPLHTTSYIQLTKVSTSILGTWNVWWGFIVSQQPKGLFLFFFVAQMGMIQPARSKLSQVDFLAAPWDPGHPGVTKGNLRKSEIKDEKLWVW